DGELLRVTTNIGILCGYDQSAYLYEWKESRWARIWETERNDYTKYDPQNIEDVIVSPLWFDDAKMSRLVLTLGTSPWCSSNWHPVYYQLWRVDQAGSRLLVDGKNDNSYLGVEPALNGAIRRKDPFDQNSAETVLVEFTVGSIDAGVHSRE